MKRFTQIWAIIAVALVVFWAFNFVNVIHSPIYRDIPVVYVFSLDFFGVSSWYLVHYVMDNIHTLWLRNLSITLCLLFVAFPLYVNFRIFF